MNQPNHMTNPWTEEREALLRELWPGDTTCKQIAALLGGGITKCGVIGKARRIHLDARAIVINGIKVFRNRKPVEPSQRRPRPTPEQRIERRRASNRISMARKRAQHREEPSVQPSIIPAPVYADSRNMRFDELEYGLCKFPTTPHDAGPLEHRFCGQPAYELTPYCRHHYELATTGYLPYHRTTVGDQKRHQIGLARAAKLGTLRSAIRPVISDNIVMTDES